MKRRYPQLSEHYTARAHRGVSLPDFLPFPRIVHGPVRGICEFDTLFFIFFLFSIPLTRYTHYAPGGEIDTLLTRFYRRGWCTGPNETCPPPPPPPPGKIPKLTVGLGLPSSRQLRLTLPPSDNLKFFSSFRNRGALCWPASDISNSDSSSVSVSASMVSLSCGCFWFIRLASKVAMSKGPCC